MEDKSVPSNQYSGLAKPKWKSDKSFEFTQNIDTEQVNDILELLNAAETEQSIENIVYKIKVLLNHLFYIYN